MFTYDGATGMMDIEMTIRKSKRNKYYYAGASYDFTVYGTGQYYQLLNFGYIKVLGKRRYSCPHPQNYWYEYKMALTVNNALKHFITEGGYGCSYKIKACTKLDGMIYVGE